MEEEVTAAEEAMSSGILFDPSKLSKSFLQKREAEVEVPELNELMGLEPGQVATIKIKQLDLDAFMKAKTLVEDQVRNLVEGVVYAAEKVNEVEEHVMYALKKKSPQVQYFINVCKGGIVEPKLKDSQLLLLAEHFPMVVQKIASQIILLTKKGASLKKNS